MKQKDSGEDQKETQITFRPFRSAAQEQHVQQQKVSVSDTVTRKDLFLMSFLSFITGGILILGLLFFTGAITGNVILDLPGEKEQVVEETAVPVIEPSIQNTTEVIEEIVVEEEPEVVEESDLCGPENDITLKLNELYDHNGRTVKLELAGEYAAQISVGGKLELMSVGETMDVNGLSITLVDGNEVDATAIIEIACE